MEIWIRPSGQAATPSSQRGGSESSRDSEQDGELGSLSASDVRSLPFFLTHTNTHICLLSCFVYQLHYDCIVLYSSFSHYINSSQFLDCLMSPFVPLQCSLFPICQCVLLIEASVCVLFALFSFSLFPCLLFKFPVLCQWIKMFSCHSMCFFFIVHKIIELTSSFCLCFFSSTAK